MPKIFFCLLTLFAVVCYPACLDEPSKDSAECATHEHCDDGNRCTIDHCTNGVCDPPDVIAQCIVPSCTHDLACDDGNDCTTDVCNMDQCQNWLTVACGADDRN